MYSSIVIDNKTSVSIQLKEKASVWSTIETDTTSTVEFDLGEEPTTLHLSIDFSGNKFPITVTQNSVEANTAWDDIKMGVVQNSQDVTPTYPPGKEYYAHWSVDDIEKSPITITVTVSD